MSMSQKRLLMSMRAKQRSKSWQSERSIRMLLSLAFLAPDIVKAAVGGCLPRGFGLTRLIDLPIAWSDQWEALELKAPVRA